MTPSKVFVPSFFLSLGLLYTYLHLRTFKVYPFFIANFKNKYHCANDGRNELRQLFMYWKLKLKINTDKAVPLEELATRMSSDDVYTSVRRDVDKNKYAYNMSHVLLKTEHINQRNISMVSFLINEFVTENVRGKGGTTFRIKIKGYEKPSPASTFTTSTCPVHDFFNGSYLCACALYGRQNDVNIIVMNTEFNGYNQVKGQNRVVIKKTFNGSSATQVPTNSCNSSFDFQIFHEPYHWYHSSSNHKLIENGCQVMQMSTDNIKKCFQRYTNNIAVMGDSHLTYTFFYLLNLGQHPEAKKASKMHHNLYVGNFSYYWSDFMNSTRIKLETFYENITKSESRRSSSHILILDGGTWDLTHIGPHHMVLGFIKLRKKIKDLQIRFKKNKMQVRIIWQMIPSYPFNIWGRQHNFWRNSHIISALNNWACSKLEELDIPCLNAMEITLDWQEKPVCDSHMLCAQNGKISGISGKMVVHKLLNIICQ